MKQQRERGQSLAEFALVAPLLFILIFGIIDIARLYQAWVTVQGAAREGARYGVTGRTDCELYTDDRAGCVEFVALAQAASLPGSADGLSVSTKSWAFPEYTTQSAAGDPGAQCDMIEVSVGYDYEPSTPVISKLIGGVHITGTERLVNEPFGTCQ
ncbi:MAG: TadE/TadG family type IV pilus assembly protein [Dehalococcoidia bacterium]